MQLCIVDIIARLLILRLIVIKRFFSRFNKRDHNINVFIPQVCAGGYEQMSSTISIGLWFYIPTIPG